MRYFHKLFDALSQVLNVLLFNGEANYSLSGDAYRFKRKWLMWLFDWFFYVLWQESDHCYHSYYNDVKRAGELLAEHRRTHAQGA